MFPPDKTLSFLANQNTILSLAIRSSLSFTCTLHKPTQNSHSIMKIIVIVFECFNKGLPECVFVFLFLLKLQAMTDWPLFT